jgi:hypothetical protein
MLRILTLNMGRFWPTQAIRLVSRVGIHYRGSPATLNPEGAVRLINC